MQRLISSLAIVSLYLFPPSVLAQHQFGGEYYQNNYWQNQGGGDTVLYNGRVLTNNLPPNTDTCGWVRSQGLSCQYFYEQRNSTGYTTHYVGRPRLRRDGQNYPLHQQNPGWNNGGCIYDNGRVRILCN